MVVRPAGFTGRLAQVIDSLTIPDVLEKSRLLGDPTWTGLVLIPRRGASWGWIGWTFVPAAVAGLVLVHWFWIRRRAVLVE